MIPRKKMCSKDITLEDLHLLLGIFEKKAYDAVSAESGKPEDLILKKCEALFKLDYSLIELDNSNGKLCARYPNRIFIPEYEQGAMSRTITPNSISCQSGENGPRTTITTDSSINSEGGNSTANSTAPTSESSTESTQSLQQEQEAIPPSLYPQIQLQTQPQQRQQRTIYEEPFDSNRVREILNMAKYARCRQRFVVPVLMYRGKYICRSATISVSQETYGRKYVNYVYEVVNGTTEREPPDSEDPTDESLITPINQTEFSYEEVIKSDIQLLKALNVKTIVDLMVEKRKVKYLVTVSSSEKVESQYEDFNILSLPYPGCEFFKEYRNNNYVAEKLFYNWEAAFNDAVLSVPKLGPADDMDICWEDYTKWDLVLITQNYLKATLKYLQEENSGLLIHCISGWDRTPLFISLVRFMLWADGHVHQSLSPLQMTYFTLAYDWYLFGHQLPDRRKRDEEIMVFCFQVLKYLTEDEFSITEPSRRRTKTTSSSGSSIVIVKSDLSEDEHAEKIDFEEISEEINTANGEMAITDNFYAATTISDTATNKTPPKTTPPSTSAAAVQNSGATSTTPMLTNRSPNTKRTKTSPILVPGPAAAARRRNESNSSNGSWLVVTETGSIDKNMNPSINIASTPNTFSNSSGTNPSTSQDGSSTSSTPTAATPQVNARTPMTIRYQRLNAIRVIFLNAYSKAAGLKFKEGSSTTLATLVGNTLGLTGLT